MRPGRPLGEASLAENGAAANNRATEGGKELSRASVWTSVPKQITLTRPRTGQGLAVLRTGGKPRVPELRKTCSAHLCVQRPTPLIRHEAGARQIRPPPERSASARLLAVSGTERAERHWPDERADWSDGGQQGRERTASNRPCATAR